MHHLDNSLKARFRRKPLLTAIGVVMVILYASDAVRDFATGFERGYNEQRLG